MDLEPKHRTAIKPGVAIYISLLRILIRRIRMFMGLLDPNPDPLVRGMDPAPDPSITKQK